MSRSSRLAVLSLVLLALPAAPARADVSGADIVTFLNGQRAAAGLPAGIAEDPQRSDACAKHDAYGARNGVLTHGEDAGRPGYTPEGDQTGKEAVLYAGGGPWTAARNPFEEAPIHLHQLLAPRIDRMGAAEVSGYGCATTLSSRNRPAPAADVTYTYPGDGATGWPAAQLASEGPYTPGEQVGIPAGTTTGPYLYVMFDGPDLSVFDTASGATATLTGPGGPVDVAVVDNTTPGLVGYLPTGMEVIPRRPLAARTTYTATVSASVSTQGGNGPARTFTRTFSFTTGGRPNAVRVAGTSQAGGRVTVRVASDAPGGTVTAKGAGGEASAPIAGGQATLTLAPGAWTVCAATGGGDTGFEAAYGCGTVTVAAAAVPVPAPAVKRSDVVRVPRTVRRGRSFRVRVRLQAARRVGVQLRTRSGRRLVVAPRQRLTPGRWWTYRFRAPAGLRKGTRLRVRVTLDGRVVTRAIRLR